MNIRFGTTHANVVKNHADECGPGKTLRKSEVTDLDVPTSLEEIPTQEIPRLRSGYRHSTAPKPRAVPTLMLAIILIPMSWIALLAKFALAARYGGRSKFESVSRITSVHI